MSQNIVTGGLLDFIFPPLCLGCGAFTESPSQICDDCEEKIERFTDPICLECETILSGESFCRFCNNGGLPCYAVAQYLPPMRDVIIQYKFRGITRPADLVADWFHDRFGERLLSLRPDTLVPVPLHPSRENFRGYNQAALFAVQLGERLGLPVHNDLLVRVKRRRPQARLGMAARQKNITGVFCAMKNNLNLRRIVLVDDVVTSGATVREARAVLEKTGAEVIAVAAMAHGL
ncbi:MAG TPA: ComF family protein [candidate division Zixibacteria bacterium]|nr:ComF family protein [candidate division Zixibacteria bacterium]